MLCQAVFSQEEKDTKELSLPGDNLDRYAVLLLFRKAANDDNLILFN